MSNGLPRYIYLQSIDFKYFIGKLFNVNKIAPVGGRGFFYLYSIIAVWAELLCHANLVDGRGDLVFWGLTGFLVGINLTR